MKYECVAHLGSGEGEGNHSFSFEFDTAEECLDEVFFLMNSQDTTPLQARSMSVGDAVSVCPKRNGGLPPVTRYFICLSVGWCEVSEGAFKDWMRYEWTQRLTHPLSGAQDPLLALLHVQKMKEGFLRERV